MTARDGPARPEDGVRRQPEPHRGSAHRDDPAAADATRRRDHLPSGARAVLRLQASVGNAAVTRALSRKPAARPSRAAASGRAAVQRFATPPATIAGPPPTPSAPVPAEDPGFRAVAGQVKTTKKSQRSHPHPKHEAEAAQAAAHAPPDDKQAQAQAAQAGDMAAAKPGAFDKAAFIAAVNQAIADKAPKNLEEAADFGESGKADAIPGAVVGQVSKGKEQSAKPLADTTGAAPDTSRATEKPVTELPPKAPPPAAKIDGAAAMPPKAPREQTDFSAGQPDLEQKMADSEVTEEQLADSNEPEFTGALDAKAEHAEHSATAPGQVREKEAATLATARGGAAGSAQKSASAMVASNTRAKSAAGGRQGAAKSKDEENRLAVTNHVKEIFGKTKSDVEKILGELDGKVTDKFTAGEKDARHAFTADHKARMDAYKDDRYSGIIGKGRWLRDKLRGLPKEADQIYATAKAGYESRMQALISDIADLVGAELTRAKDRVAAGRAELDTYVNGLAPALKQIGQEAQTDIADQFKDLESSVDEKSDSLAHDLADKYVEARNAVDEEIKAEQEANKGLLAKAWDAVGGAITTILHLKDLLLGVLSRAVEAIGTIIKHPIQFLENFVGAVKAGVSNFAGNIVEHLKEGLQAWLFGALAETGIELPEQFDLKGIIKLVLSLLGLTWNTIRARILKFVPEPVVKVIETSVDFVQAILSEGVIGLWKWIAAKFDDLEEMVLGQIKDFVITKVITAGVTWLISLLNPAAAFIKACKMIYDAVMWFVDNAERLKDFVDSVFDSIVAIANGGVGAVAGLIEKTLAKAIPMVISGLASLLGLGGITEKVRGVFEKIQKPVMGVVDKLVGTAVKYGKGVMAKLGRSKVGAKAKAFTGKAKEAVASAKSWAKARVAGGKPATPAGPDPRAELAQAVSVKRPITMLGRTHHVWAQVTGGKATLMIASTPEVMLGRLELALDHPSVKTDTTATGRLKALRGDLRRFEADYQRAYDRSVRTEIVAAESALTAHLATVASELDAVGQKYDITALKGTEWTTPDGEIRPEYRGKKLRPTFYGPTKTYRRHAGALLTAAHQKKQQLAALFTGNPMMKQTTYYCPGVPGKTPPHLARDVDGVQVDHKESVVSHWYNIGRGKDQATRNGWYGDVTNLEAICPRCNRVKGSDGEHFEHKVLPGFAGPP